MGDSTLKAIPLSNLGSWYTPSDRCFVVDTALQAQLSAGGISARAQSVEEEIDRHLSGQIADSCAGVQRLSPAQPKPERVVPPFPQRAYDRMRSGEAPTIEEFWLYLDR